MNKNFKFKKGDKVTYKLNIGQPRELLVGTLFNGETIEYFENYISKSKILKVERPTYTTVYEVKEILDKQEKKYLSDVIRPFRDKVKSIVKYCSYNGYYIEINFKNEVSISFPYFKENTMYKGMEDYKEYTLEELGL